MNVLVKEGILGAILLIMGVFDRLYIDWHWVGRTQAWIIPGTEDLMPCRPTACSAYAFCTANQWAPRWALSCTGNCWITVWQLTTACLTVHRALACGSFLLVTVINHS